MKFFISTSVFMNQKYDSLFGARFNPETIAQLKEDYSEVRGFSPCNPVFSALQSNVKNAINGSSSAATNSWRTIANASKRLANAFLNTTGISKRDKKQTVADTYFTSYELQQLRTIYGVNTTRMTEEEAIAWAEVFMLKPAMKQVWKATKRKAKSLLESTKDVANDVAEFFKKDGIYSQ